MTRSFRALAWPLAAALFALSAPAWSASVSISPGTATGAAGGPTTPTPLALTFAGDGVVAGFETEVAFNPAIFEATVAAANGGSCGVNNTTGVVVVQYIDGALAPIAAGPTTFCNITLGIEPAAAAGTYALDVRNALYADGTGNPAPGPHTENDGSVTVTAGGGDTITVSYNPAVAGTVNFPAGTIGTTGDSAITVTANAGTGTATVNNCALSGLNPSAFTILSGNVSLTASQSDTLDLRCTREAAIAQATLTCQETDADSANAARSWPLSCPAGTATSNITLSYNPVAGTTINFPAGATGGVGTSTIAVTAAGTTGTGSINTCSFSGAGAGAFTVTNGSVSLAGGQSDNLAFSCTRAVAAQTASLTCVENDSDSTNTNRVWPVSCPAGSAVNDVVLGYAPPVGTTVTLSAGATGGTGTAAIAVNATGTSGTGNLAGCAISGADAAFFNVTPTSLSLSAGQNDTLDLTCTRAAAVRSATITCNETDADSTNASRAWPLSCPAGAPAGDVTLGYAPPSGTTVTLSAGPTGGSGTAAITVNATGTTGTGNLAGCSLSGADAAFFGVNPTSVSLTGGQSAPLNLTCTRAAAARSASLTCQETDADSTNAARTWPLSCPAGTAGNTVTVAYAPPASSTILFPSGAPGQALTNIQVNASGAGGTATVNGCALSGVGAGAFTITNGSVSLSGGQTGNLGLACERQATVQNASLTCVENDSDSTNVNRTWSLSCPVGAVPVTTLVSYAPPAGSAINFPGGSVGGSGSATITVSGSSGAGQARVENCSVSGGNGAFTVLTGSVMVNPLSSADLVFQCTRQSVARSGLLTCSETDGDSTNAARSWTVNCPSGAAVNDATTTYAPPPGSVVAFPGGTVAEVANSQIGVTAVGTGGSIQISSCSASGPQSGNFTVPNSSLVLAAGQSGNIPLQCTRLSIPQQATLSCLENDSDSASATRTWQLDCPAGTPSNVNAVYTPEAGVTVTFPAGPVNSPAPASITVRSEGTSGTVRVNGCSLSGAADQLSAFNIIQGSVTLDPGQTDAIDLQCVRNAAARNATLTCLETDSNNNNNTPRSWPLSCPAGVAPNDVQVTYNPTTGSTISFPGGMVGNVANNEITITATGTAGQAKVDTCAISGSGAAGFKVTPTSATLNPGQTAKLALTCTSIAQPQEATLTCNETDSNSAAIPVSWSLSCAAGIVPDDVTTTFSPNPGTSITFPAGPQNTNALGSIQVTAAGTTGTSQISQCAFTGPGAPAFRILTGNVTLAPGDSRVLDLRCLRGATAQNATLTCLENDSDSTNAPREFPLVCPAGTAINSSRISYEPTPGTTVVPAVVGTAGTPGRLPITVRSTGSGATAGEARVDNCTLGGEHPEAFTLPSSEVRLQPGQQADLAAECTFGAEAQRATLTCDETDGDSMASPRSWNLSCPVARPGGNDSVLEFAPAPNATVTFPTGPNGQAALASVAVAVSGTSGSGTLEDCQISGSGAGHFTLLTNRLTLAPGEVGEIDMSCGRNTQTHTAQLSCRATDSGRDGVEVKWPLSCPAANPIAPVIQASPSPEDANPLTCDGAANERVTRIINISNVGSPGPASTMTVACAASGTGFAITPFAPQRLVSGATFPFTLTCTVPPTGTRTGAVVCNSNATNGSTLTYGVSSSVRQKPALAFNPNGGNLILQGISPSWSGSTSAATRIRLTTSGGQGGAPASYSCAVPTGFQVTNASNDEVLPGAIPPDLAVTCTLGSSQRAVNMPCQVSDQQGTRTVSFGLTCPSSNPNQQPPQVRLAPSGGTIDLPLGEGVGGERSGEFAIQVLLNSGVGTATSQLDCQGPEGLVLTNNIQTRLSPTAQPAPVLVACTLGSEAQTLPFSCNIRDSGGFRTVAYTAKCPAGNATADAAPILSFNPPTGETLEPPRGTGSTSGTTIISVSSAGGNGTGRAAFICDATRGFALTNAVQDDLARGEDPLDIGLSCAVESGVFSGELLCDVLDGSEGSPRTVRYNLLCPSSQASPGNGAGAKWVSEVSANQPINCTGTPGTASTRTVRVSNFGLSGSNLSLSCLATGPGFNVSPSTASLRAGQAIDLNIGCAVPAQGMAMGELRCTTSDTTQSTLVFPLRALAQGAEPVNANMIPATDLKGLMVLILLCLGVGGWSMRRR
jgi:hypothetical protein